MKTFQELRIKMVASPEQTIEEIAAFLPDSWRRDTDREADLTALIRGKNYCFEFKSAQTGRALLYISPSEAVLKVMNIVPVDKSQLTIDEYNRILDAFVQGGVKEHFEFEVTKSDVELSDLISSESAQMFYAFSHGANKSTGRSHPMDERRWLEFVLNTVRRQESISSDDLLFFLMEDGWDEQSAYDLCLDYSYGFRAMQYALAGGTR